MKKYAPGMKLGSARIKSVPVDADAMASCFRRRRMERWIASERLR